MFTSPYSLILTGDERDELESMTRSRTLAAGLVQRARVVLAIADGEPYSVIGSRLELSTPASPAGANASRNDAFLVFMMEPAAAGATGSAPHSREKFSPSPSSRRQSPSLTGRHGAWECGLESVT